ncbi:MAG TPA: aminoacyl-tRNA hydrolase [Candidatus Paceibacterota bacterium]|nr:aminoacyl-tRNA hydrolase [Candidatus Paceibacterota bacterium]HRZ34600.1 aminoacyl-tRNA hydrolase [Candidatus Paceibacterota bacterium]
MKFVIGLGNPSERYEETRHNIGRDIVRSLIKKFKFDDFVYDKKVCASLSEGKIGREKVLLILPDTYMNNSGLALKKFINNKKKALDMVVIHDELDMGVGSSKIVFNKSSGGHRGVESVIRAVKTEAFPRIKIGISPTTGMGKIKKPSGEKAVVAHVLGKFSSKEQEILKKIKKKTVDSIETIVTDGYLLAMNKFN